MRAAYPELPWREIADTRNRLLHEYFDVDMAIVAAIVQDDLPSLLAQIEDILGRMQP